MSQADYAAWFCELDVLFQNITDGCKDFNSPHMQGWLVEAASLIEAAIPPGHRCHAEWCSMERELHHENPAYTWPRLFAVLQASGRMVRNGRLGSFRDSVRAETELELLDQASVLLKSNDIVAATLIAGGALETHLCNLAACYQLTINGDGSISKYNDAISKARNNGTKVDLTTADSKQITYWGDLRNQAAHKPLEFHHDAEKIELMILGVRNFIARTT